MSIILLVVAGYLLVGFVVALVIHFSGALVRIDPGVKDAGVVFRVLITPGMTALWPLMLNRKQRANKNEPNFPNPEKPVPPHRQRRLHGLAMKTLAVVLPIMMALALMNRPDPITNPEQLTSIDTLEPLVRTVYEDGEAFNGEAIAMAVRSDRYGWHYQLELAMAGSMPLTDDLLAADAR